MRYTQTSNTENKHPDGGKKNADCKYEGGRETDAVLRTFSEAERRRRRQEAQTERRRRRQEAGGADRRPDRLTGRGESPDAGSAASNWVSSSQSAALFDPAQRGWRVSLPGQAQCIMGAPGGGEALP